MSGDPLVDINIAVYNHASFLRKALESALSQETTFPFRLLVGDDCSTDGSIEILKEFEAKYPQQVKVIYQERNLGLHSPERNGVILLKKSTAKYIALLDGDDYWSDRHKLQRQIDFLETHPDYAICFHEVYHLEEGKDLEVHPLSDIPQTYTILDLAERGNFIYTASVVFRNAISELPDWYAHLPVGDYPLHMVNASKGKVYYLPEPMAVYRKFVGVYGKQTAIRQNYNWYKTLEGLIVHFQDEKVVSLVRKNQARSLLYMYENQAIDQLNELVPQARDILDLTALRSPDQLMKFSVKQLFLAFWRKLFLSLRHNPLANKISRKSS